MHHSKGKSSLVGDVASNLKAMGSAKPPKLPVRDIRNLNYWRPIQEWLAEKVIIHAGGSKLEEAQVGWEEDWQVCNFQEADYNMYDHLLLCPGGGGLEMVNVWLQASLYQVLGDNVVNVETVALWRR